MCWLGLTREASSSSCLNSTCDGEATWADGTEFAFDQDLVNTVHFSAKNERACARIIQVDPKKHRPKKIKQEAKNDKNRYCYKGLRREKLRIFR